MKQWSIIGIDMKIEEDIRGSKVYLQIRFLVRAKQWSEWIDVYIYKNQLKKARYRRDWFLGYYSQEIENKIIGVRLIRQWSWGMYVIIK